MPAKLPTYKTQNSKGKEEVSSFQWQLYSSKIALRLCCLVLIAQKRQERHSLKFSSVQST